MQTRSNLHALVVLLVLGSATAAEAQVQPELAKRYFEEATRLCERDAGRLWRVSLCGPMVIVDRATGTRATSQPEPEGPPPRFSGFADGPVSWGGLRWFAWPLSMLPEKDADARQQIMLHGLFHRIQPELGLIAEDGFNEHLDTLEGRFWIQVEWRALRRAVESSGSDRAEAIADALAFRRERRRLFPGAADNERRDEIREGLATYTGVAAWANSPADAARAAASALAGGESQPAFVGNFEAHSGPAYGVASTSISSEAREGRILTIKRMDNVLIVVDDLEATKAFFIELGFKLEGETTVEGPSVGSLIGLKDVRATLAMMRTPDGQGIELDKFHTPNAIRFGPVDAPVNTLGIRRIMFAVDDIDAVVARMRAHGAELIGEMQYEDTYRLAYIRGPEGIIVALAEQLG